MNARLRTPGESKTWTRLLAFQVTEGVEMSLHEIAAVAGVTKQAIASVEERALRKLARQSKVMKQLMEFLR